MGMHKKRGLLVLAIVFLILLVFAIGFPTLNTLGYYSNFDPINNASQDPSIRGNQVWVKVGEQETWLQEAIDSGSLGGSSTTNASLPTCSTGQTLVANATGHLECSEVAQLTPPSCETGQVVIINALGNFDCGTGGEFGEEALLAESALSYGGTGFDAIYKVDKDSLGNTYVIGVSNSTSLNFGNGITYTRGSSEGSLIIVKFNSNGIAQWLKNYSLTGFSQYLNENTHPLYSNVLLDENAGSVYFGTVLSGVSTTYNFGEGQSLPKSNGNNYLSFVGKINASTGQLQWVRGINDTSNSAWGKFDMRNILADSQGNVIVFGDINTNVSVTVSFGGLSRVKPAGIHESLMVKYSSTGVPLWYNTYQYRSSNGRAYGEQQSILDANDNVYLFTTLTAYASGSCLPACISSYDYGNGVILNTTLYDHEVALIKYNSNGLAQWARAVRSHNPDSPKAIGIDGDSNIYILGISQTPNFGSGINLSTVQDGVFLAKYDSNGQILNAQRLPTILANQRVNILSTGTSDIYLYGHFSGSYLDFGNNIIYLRKGVGTETYLAKLDGLQNKFVSIIGSAGNSNDYVTSAIVDSDLNVELFGYSNSSTIDFFNSVLYASSSTPMDMFRVKYSLQSNVVPLLGNETVLVYSEGSLMQTTTQTIADLASSGIVRILNNDSVSTSTSLRDANGMSFVYEPNSVYVLDLYLIVNTSVATTGFGFVLGTSTAVPNAGLSFVHQLANGTGTLTGGSFNGNQNIIGISSGTPSTSTQYVQGSGILITGSEGGVATLRHRSETAATTTLKKDSAIVVKKLR
jgi:hypothetical protein